MRRLAFAARIGDDGRFEPRAADGLGRKLRDEFGVDDDGAGVRVREIEPQEVRRRERVQEHGHEPRPDRAHREGHVHGRVVQQQRHALARPEPERAQRMTGPGRQRAQVPVGQRAGGAAERNAIGMRGIGEQDVARIAALRDREADFARAGRIVRDRIPDGRIHSPAPSA